MQRVIAALGLAWTLAAQTPERPKREVVQPPAPAFYPIEGLGVEGNKIYTAEQILAASGLRVGMTGGRVFFDAARDRLLATGYFASVGYRFEPAPGGTTYLAGFQVVEIPEVLPWHLEDLPVKKEDFERAARAGNPLFGAKLPATDVVLANHRRILQDLAAKQGAPLTVVSKVEPEGTEMAIVFRPNVPRQTVASVQFTGNQKVESRFLQQAIGPIAIGAPWYEPRFREFLQNHITPLYEARGLVRVAYPKITTAPSTAVRGLVVTVEVVEGEPYKLSRIEVRGSGLDGDDLQRDIPVKLDETVNFSEIGRGTERVIARLKNSGYLQAGYKAERRVNDPEKAVEVTIQVAPGPQYKFRKLELVGLDLESEPAVRKMWSMKEGEPFRSNYPEYFLQRIREDRVFDNLGKTTADVKRDDSAAMVDVRLTFRGEELKEGEKRRRTPN